VGGARRVANAITDPLDEREHHHAMGEEDEHFGNGDAEHTGPLPGLT
jgi:hypothetical protein